MSGFEVLARECDQCLFSNQRIVRPARMRDVLEECRRRDTHFICHKSSIAGGNAACRGWYDRFDSNLSRIADRLGVVEFIDPPEVP